jgi:tetratricopeptide (TPR) repeat protein
MQDIILTLARSGATQRAWDAFIAAGLDGVGDINALTLKGRLLKDRARQAAGAERRALFAQSGAAYAQAATLRPDSYPLINAAAMTLFAGDNASAASIARDVLTLVDGDPSQGETPYWREATRAEALLLLGRMADAKASLAAAIRLAPQAWEDHASTLRQFAAILAERREDSSWLDQHRPAPSLHFSGILGIAPEDADAAYRIHAAILEIAPGAGYGALAAGADIIAAEALLARGAELHVVLPAGIGQFRQSSVTPFGMAWNARFDALIGAATSLTICSDDDEPSRAGIALADYHAMGLAAERAALLESRAVAMRIEPSDRPALGDPWLASGRPIIHVAVPVSAPSPDRIRLKDGRLLFFLAPGGDADVAEPMGYASLAEVIPAMRRSVASAAIDCRVDDDRSITVALLENAAPGTVVASMAAAMALMAEGRAERIEPLGEMETAQGPTRVYAIRLTEP